MSSAPGRSWRSPSRAPRTSGPRGGEAGPSRGKTPSPPRWRRAAREEASGGRGPSPSCRTPIPPPGPASPRGPGRRKPRTGRGPSPVPCGRRRRDRGPREDPRSRRPPPGAVEPQYGALATGRTRMSPEAGVPRRCGGVDEAACGANGRGHSSPASRRCIRNVPGERNRQRADAGRECSRGDPSASQGPRDRAQQPLDGGRGHPSPPLEPRVGCVLDPLAQEIVSEDGDQDGQTGIDGEPPRELDVVLPRREDVPPGRGGRLPAGAKERGALPPEDGPGGPQGGPDEDGGERVGEDMAEDDPQVARPLGPGRRHEVPLLQRKRLGPYEPCGSHPVGEPDDDHDVDDRRPEEGDDGEDQEKGGETEHDIDEPHEDAVDTPPVESGDQPHHETDGRGDPRGHEADFQGDPRPVDHPREDVPPQFVGPQRVLRGGRREDPEDVDPVRVPVGHQGRDGRNREKQRDDDPPTRREPVPKQPAEEIPEDGARPRAHADSPYSVRIRGSAKAYPTSASRFPIRVRKAPITSAPMISG